MGFLPRMVLLLLFASCSYGDIYTWQDQHGKTHYGDAVPARYQEKAKAIEVSNSNSMPLKATNQAREPSLKNVNIYPKKAKAKKTPKSKTRACQIKKARYEENSRCFASCRFGSNHYLNGRCVKLKGCVNISKPDCD